MMRKSVALTTPTTRFAFGDAEAMVWQSQRAKQKVEKMRGFEAFASRHAQSGFCRRFKEFDSHFVPLSVRTDVPRFGLEFVEKRGL